MTVAQPSAPTPIPLSVSGRSAALEGLRGVAILGVLLFHTGQLAGGFLGVDLFFVLSGYLITGLLLREVRGAGRIDVIAFWGRRCRRLFPALAVVLVVVTLSVWATGAADLLRSALSDGPWVQASLVNWHLLAESADYWVADGHQRVFEHLWSIAVEEQFYVIWPVVVIAVARWGRRPEVGVLVVAVVGAIGSVLLMAGLYDPAATSRMYTGTDTRAFALLLGAAAATEPVRRVVAALGQRVRAVACALAATGLTVAWVLVDGTEASWLYLGGLAVFSCAAAVLVFLVAQSSAGGFPRLFMARPLVFVGGISYGMYLWHWPVIVLLSSPQLGVGLEGWPLTVTALGLSIGVATLMKRLLEDPIRHRAAWATGRTGGFAFAVTTVALIALWIVVPAPAPVTIDVGDLG